jgi:dihydrofolate synthase/folylpolyglutamate synthase
LDNAATALLAITELRDLGYAISEEAISRGFKEVVWPGRLELISRKPLILLDGAHNPEGIAALAESLQHIQREEGEGTFTFLFGMMNNKNLSLLDPLIPLARRFVFSQAESGRLPAMEPSRMADYVRGHGVEAVAFEDLAEAVQEAKGTPPLCICGSLYLIGSVKRFLRPSL